MKKMRTLKESSSLYCLNPLQPVYSSDLKITEERMLKSPIMMPDLANFSL